MVTNPQQVLTTPPLENGDRLSRAEFERRYEAMPELRKAELVEGVVYIASPLRIKSHGEPHGNIVTWLGTYKAFTPGVILGIEPTVRLDPDNEPQLDAVLFIPGQRASISRDDYDDYIETISKARQTSLSKLLPAAPPLTYMTKSGSIAAIRFRNTSSGARWKGS